MEAVPKADDLLAIDRKRPFADNGEMLGNRGLSKRITAERGLFLYGVFLFLVLYPMRPAAQERTEGGHLTISIVEIGPGDEFFSWWGHLAVMVDNELSGKSFCYDFGVFSFDDPGLVCNFLKGDLHYKIMAGPARDELEWYIQNNRDITLYTLNLDGRQKERIVEFLDRSVLPENRDYLYKIFTDNCVTRVLLIVDEALDGKFMEKYKNEKGRFTLREHAERHLYRSVVLYALLNFIMGEEIDGPLSKYEEMYLPSEFSAALVGFTYEDADGNIQPLVSGVEKINTAIGRPAVLSRPPRDKWYAFFAGMAEAGFFILLVMFRKKNRGLRIVFGVTQSLVVLYWALMGTLLFYAMFFSRHTYTYNNINIMYANPLLFAGVPFGILYAFTGHERKRIFYSRVLKVLWTCILTGAVFSIVFRIAGFNHTDNTLTLLLIVPTSIVSGYFGDLMYKTGAGLFHRQNIGYKP
jgi:hypothetical protein